MSKELQPVLLKMDQNLHELRALTLTMAGYIEESIDYSMKALIMRDKNQLSQVWQIEEEVNALHKKIDKSCFKVLACQSPVASDLRLILAIIKINVDLERMGDLACNNSYAIQDYLQTSPNIIVQQIKEMATTVTKMVRDCFDAFMDKNVQQAKDVLTLDDTVDEFRNQMREQLKVHLKSGGPEVEMSMALLSVVRNLERLADHATNIAEEIIFYLTGFDVRHEEA